MPPYVAKQTTLGWLIVAGIVADIVIPHLPPWGEQLSLALVPISAASILWAIGIISWRLNNVTDEKVRFRRPTHDDYWRLFGALFLGLYHIAGITPSLFWTMSVVALPIVGCMLTIMIVEIVEKKSVSGFAFGCLAFVLFTLWVEKAAFVKHYGVPIIGHFFEAPSFNAEYYVRARDAEAEGEAVTALANIRVVWGSKEEDSGVDDSTSYSRPFREIWIDKLRFPGEGWISVDDQEFPISMDEGQQVRDAKGREWYVSMTKRRAQ